MAAQPPDPDQLSLPQTRELGHGHDLQKEMTEKQEKDPMLTLPQDTALALQSKRGDWTKDTAMMMKMKEEDILKKKKVALADEATAMMMKMREEDILKKKKKKKKVAVADEAQEGSNHLDTKLPQHQEDLQYHHQDQDNTKLQDPKHHHQDQDDSVAHQVQVQDQEEVKLLHLHLQEENIIPSIDQKKKDLT